MGVGVSGTGASAGYTSGYSGMTPAMEANKRAELASRGQYVGSAPRGNVDFSPQGARAQDVRNQQRRHAMSVAGLQHNAGSPYDNLRGNQGSFGTDVLGFNQRTREDRSIPGSWRDRAVGMNRNVAADMYTRAAQQGVLSELQNALAAGNVRQTGMGLVGDKFGQFVDYVAPVASFMDPTSFAFSTDAPAVLGSVNAMRNLYNRQSDLGALRSTDLFNQAWGN